MRNLVGFFPHLFLVFVCLIVYPVLFFIVATVVFAVTFCIILGCWHGIES